MRSCCRRTALDAHLLCRQNEGEHALYQHNSGHILYRDSACHTPQTQPVTPQNQGNKPQNRRGVEILNAIGYCTPHPCKITVLHRKIGALLIIVYAHTKKMQRMGAKTKKSAYLAWSRGTEQRPPSDRGWILHAPPNRTPRGFRASHRC